MNSKLYQLSNWVATVFKIGYLPVAPGTWGSLAAVAVWFVLPPINNVTYLLILINLFLLGIICSSVVAIVDKEKDPSKIVIDEWVGMWIALMGLPKEWKIVLLSFIIFRIFDIVKIPPARQLERLETGWGIMLDDVYVGLLAMILVHTGMYLI